MSATLYLVDSSSVFFSITASFFSSSSYAHTHTHIYQHCVQNVTNTRTVIFFFNATNHGQTTTFKRYKMELKRSSDNENLLAWKCSTWETQTTFATRESRKKTKQKCERWRRNDATFFSFYIHTLPLIPYNGLWNEFCSSWSVL